MLNTILFLKVNKFLGKIFQFEFLVMTEKNIFASKLFLSYISDFNLFLCENCSPRLKKVTPSFPATPLYRLRCCQAPPFWKFGWRLNPPPAEMRGCAHYDNSRLARTHVWKRVKLSLRGKYIIKPNPCFQAVIHRPNLYYSKISKRKWKKEYTISSERGKNRTS